MTLPFHFPPAMWVVITRQNGDRRELIYRIFPSGAGVTGPSYSTPRAGCATTGPWSSLSLFSTTFGSSFFGEAKIDVSGTQESVRTFLLRFSFAEITLDTLVIWFSLDYLMDLIYFLDILVHFRTGYLEVSECPSHRPHLEEKEDFLLTRGRL